jgi:hypothetical protein
MNRTILRPLLVFLASIPALHAELSVLHHPAGQAEAVAKSGEIILRKGDRLRIEPAPTTGSELRSLEFEFFTTTPPTSLTLRPLRKVGARFRELKLDPPGHSEAWTICRRKINGLPVKWESLELDFSLPEGGEILIRSIRWQPLSEQAVAQPRRGSVANDILEAELSLSYPARITSVEVGTERITIQGQAPGTPGSLLLAEIPMDRFIDDPDRFETLTTLPPAKDDGSFEISLPRLRQRSGFSYDRLLSRWRIVGKDGAAITPRSHAHYASEVACRSPQLPAAVHRNKKGLGGWTPDRLTGELESLGITAVTVNIIVDSLLAAPSSPDALPFTWQGRTYHANRRTLERFDATFLKAAQQDAVVSLILLVSNPARHGQTSPIAHPGASPEGTYAMPDVVSENGIAAYGAILNLIAERWSRPGFPNGRVHHWIIHNEVDAGWTWTNAGNLGALPFMDLYQRSMRLTDLIVRQYDPHARAFISLTHHWAEPGSAKFHGSRKMLELLARFTAAEGDFPWALAYHPYPANLRNPRTWEDAGVTFGFDTPKITPRNIEVLDAWMKRPEMRYRGEIRPVHLSENGFNSPDYSPKSLADQAAGMAYAWKKIRPLETIEVWHYHNWIDNRSEGGLRIGLRRFPDDPEEPLGPKPIWHLYKALGIPGEEDACAPFLPVIGITSWQEILHTAAIR